MKVAVTSQYLTDTADAIRSKLGSTAKYKTSEMAKAIDSISTVRNYGAVLQSLSGINTAVTGTAVKIDETAQGGTPVIRP